MEVLIRTGYASVEKLVPLAKGMLAFKLCTPPVVCMYAFVVFLALLWTYTINFAVGLAHK